jgi:hypothetical protein
MRITGKPIITRDLFFHAREWLIRLTSERAKARARGDVAEVRRLTKVMAGPGRIVAAGANPYSRVAEQYDIRF